MLFSRPVDERHESEKERNFYAKVLVGYWFNELVPGVERRVAAFCEVLDTGGWWPASAKVKVHLDPRTTRLTTDYHAYRAGTGSDNGECADALIVDTAASSLVAVEAKLKTDFKYAKDVVKNAARIRHVASQLGLRSAVQCLLLAESKRDGARDHHNQTGSQWALLRTHSGPPPVVVITWEQLASHTAVDERVREFVTEHLRRVGL